MNTPFYDNTDPVEVLRELLAVREDKAEVSRLKQRRIVAIKRDPVEIARVAAMKVNLEKREFYALRAARSILRERDKK